MEETAPREKVLKSIREALAISADSPFVDSNFDFKLFKDSSEIPEICFANAFKNLGGKFVYCANEIEFCQNLKAIMQEYSLTELFCKDYELIGLLEKYDLNYITDDKKLDAADCSLTRCEYLISQTGTIMVTAENKPERRQYFTSPVHFVFAYTSQIIEDIFKALNGVKSKYNKIPQFISFISGPSRTADIEKTLVMGAHGPKKLFLFLIDDPA